MPVLIDYIKHRIDSGYAPIILFVGAQRVGKTSLAMRCAYELDDKWDPKELMTFKIEDLAQIYSEHEKKIIVLDEAGVTLDPYEHMSITQRVYSHIVQTQAYKQNVLFLVLPFASEMSVRHVKHVNAIVEVFYRGAYKLYKLNSWRSDLSRRPPRQEVVEIVTGVPLPPPHIWNWYKNEGQKIYKESIMDLQNDILMSRKNKLTAKQKLQNNAKLLAMVNLREVL